MNRCLFLAALILGLASPALATHNHPQQAKLLKLRFVTAYDPCLTPNALHKPSISLGACSLPVLSTAATLTNQITFGPTGAFAAGFKVQPGDIQVRAKGKDIRNGGLPFTGTLNLVAPVRISDHGCLPPIFPSPCTVIDFVVTIPVTCVAGVCTASTTFNTLAPNTLAALDEENIEFGQVIVTDPDGDPAFRQGLFVP